MNLFEYNRIITVEMQNNLHLIHDDLITSGINMQVALNILKVSLILQSVLKKS